LPTEQGIPLLQKHLQRCAKAIAIVIMYRAFKVLTFLFFTTLLISLLNCSPVTSENPTEVYRLWNGEKPSNEIKVLNGKYWQSGHFTKEYIMYLELKAPKDWIKEFIVQNKLKQISETVALPLDAPAWFKPTATFQGWEPTDFSQGSTYYIDSANGHLMIYEIQL
jgi:hypothetical protein